MSDAAKTVAAAMKSVWSSESWVYRSVLVVAGTLPENTHRLVVSTQNVLLAGCFAGWDITIVYQLTSMGWEKKTIPETNPRPVTLLLPHSTLITWSVWPIIVETQTPTLSRLLRVSSGTATETYIMLLGIIEPLNSQYLVCGTTIAKGSQTCCLCRFGWVPQWQYREIISNRVECFVTDGIKAVRSTFFSAFSDNIRIQLWAWRLIHYPLLHSQGI